MKLPMLTGLVGLIILGVIFELVRRRQLREKYAIVWIAVALLVVPMAIFPHALDGLALRVGVASGVSLVLFMGILFLLLMAIHLSWEVSRLEEETRTLAEGIALLHTDIDSRISRLEHPAGAPEPIRARVEATVDQ